MKTKKKEKHSVKDFSIGILKTDTTDRAHQFQMFINQLSTNDHRHYWVIADSGLKPEMNIQNIASGKTENVLSFVSNDYLGMSQNTETINAGIEALKKYGSGACAAPIIGGYLDIHKQLEEGIAEFTGQEDAIIFSSGFGANVGALNAFLGKDDLALVDTYIHTSVLDGLRSTNIKYIGHNDLDYLELILKREESNYRTKMVIIDGVYSQDGDMAIVPGIKFLCDKYNALLYIDDAHGIGVFGQNGKGVVEHYGMLGNIDIITGTFSKSFGAVGGFVASSKKIIQYLRYYAGTTVFSAAITPQVTASVLKSLELVKTNPELRTNLWKNVHYLKEKLCENGFDFGKTQSPIFPIMIRDSFNTREVSKLLLKSGIYTVPITFPAVRDKESRIRLSITSSHNKSHIDKLINALCNINPELFLK